MARGFTLTLRYTATRGARVERVRFSALAETLDALENRARALAREVGRETIDLHVRRFEPEQQVAARGEVAGPRVHGGVDVRGDGSVDAFTGRLRRQVVVPLAGESPYDALRRALGSTSAEP
jgi:hypothetical protein